jgi:hypothetical protein
VVVAVEPSRLLRRALLVAAVAAAGWMLSAVFANVASADELPGDDTQAYRSDDVLGHLLGGLTDVVGGVTDVVGGVTDRVADIGGSLVDTSGDVLPPSSAPEAHDPIAEIPPGSSSGSASADRGDALPRTEVTVPPAPVVTPPAPVAPPPPVAPVAPAPVRKPVVTVPAAPVAPPAAHDTGSAAAEHAGRSEPEPEPAKTPTAPASSGTTVSTAHDNTGGARGTHSVLTAQAPLHPADAGFTTRSRAIDGAGRVAGLPASSHD